jgi:hypothetical protein
VSTIKLDYAQINKIAGIPLRRSVYFALTSCEVEEADHESCFTDIHWKKQTFRHCTCEVIHGPCHGSGGQSPASHRGDPGSHPDQSKWDLWWTKWYWNMFFSEFFCLPLAILFHGGSLGGWTIGPFVAAVQRHGLALAAWTTTTTWSNTHVTTRHLAELCNVGVTTFDVYQYSSCILSLKMSLISFYAYVTTNSWQNLIISNNNQLNTCGSHDIKNINLHMYINTCCLKV